MPANPFKRLILRAVLRDVYPMVIRLVAIPDTLHLTDFDDLFHAAASAEFVGSEQWRYQAQAVGQFSDGLDAPSTTTI